VLLLALGVLAHTAADTNALDQAAECTMEHAHLLHRCARMPGNEKAQCEADAKSMASHRAKRASGAPKPSVTDYHDSSSVNRPSANECPRSSYRHYRHDSDEESYYAADLQGDASTEYNHNHELANPPNHAKIPQATQFDGGNIVVTIDYYAGPTTVTNP
jgi:hypothetical protein